MFIFMGLLDEKIWKMDKRLRSRGIAHTWALEEWNLQNNTCKLPSIVNTDDKFAFFGARDKKNVENKFGTRC